MNIYWYGQSCFKLEGEKTTVITDPFNNQYGLKVPRLAADLVTVSHNHLDHNNVEGVKGISEAKPFVISGPGEYDYKNVFVYGVSAYHDDQQGAERGTNTMYRLEIDGIRIGHLGDLGHPLTNGMTEKMEGLDILLIPVGGTYTINAKQATELISQLEPRIVIPMHYHLPDLKVKHKLDDISVFCKEIGVCPKEKINKYKITKKDLPQNDLQIIVLEP